MIKRIFSLLIAFTILALPLALADETDAPQARQETIMLEGMEEEITTIRFESQRGYAFWYDPEILMLLPEDEGNDIDDFIPPGTPGNMYRVSVYYWGAMGYTFDEAKKVAEQTLMENYGNVNTVEGSALFKNPYCGYYALDNDTIHHATYVIDEGEGAFYISVSYPAEAAEGFGDRVIQMLWSFEILRTPENRVTMSIQSGSLTPSGATVILENHDDCTYIYGEEFKLGHKRSDIWETLQPIIDNYAFTAVAYGIGAGETKEIEVAWEWLYGALDAGEYRIVKNFDTTDDTGALTEVPVYAEFTIE